MVVVVIVVVTVTVVVATCALVVVVAVVVHMVDLVPARNPWPSPLECGETCEFYRHE